MYYSILVPKETRAAEKRVALIPQDIRTLIKQGHKVFVEHNAGQGAGFSDQDYQNVGAIIRSINEETLIAYQQFFKDITLIVRAKRPDYARERLENKAINSGTIMVGALDPLEKNSPHIMEYQQAKIIAYSIDQMNLSVDDPMNLLAAMSKIAGRLALLDAIEKFQLPVKKLIIIGFGVVGRAAFAEALKQKIPTLVVLTNSVDAKEIIALGAQTVLLDKNTDLVQQQQVIKNIVVDADIIIASARRANELAPVLVPTSTLAAMRKKSVIVDMVLSEGGNVEGSEHDKTLLLGNDVIVTNTSGYPKAFPYEASEIWSKVSLQFINLLAMGKKLPLLPLT